MAQEQTPDDGPLFCTVHPDRETHLRCNRCGRPMCSQCAVRMPVGYRCRECMREQQAVFYTATRIDYVIAAVAAFFGSLAASYLVMLIPWLLFQLLLAPVAGALIPQIVLTVIRRRRGRYMGEVVVAAIIAGGVVSQWPTLQWLFMGAPPGGILTSLIWPALFSGIVAVVAYGWFRFGGKRY